MISDDTTDAEDTGELDDTSPYKVLEGESAEEYFQRILHNSSEAEIFLEYLIFLKSLPDLHSNDLRKIQCTVRRELGIEKIEDEISMIDLRFSSGSPYHHPVLNALECVRHPPLQKKR